MDVFSDIRGRLGEIERHADEWDADNWVPQYADLLIRAVRQLGAAYLALEEALGPDAHLVGVALPDPDVLELLEGEE